MLRKTLTLLAMILATTSAAFAAAPRRRAVSPLPAAVVNVADDFRHGELGWDAAFADYSPESGGMDLAAAIRQLPTELGISGTGFFISGNNHSDDLFMFIVKKLTAADGLRPNQPYQLSFRATLASQAGSGCGGIGGSPGDSVYLKAGAAGEKPAVFLDSGNHYRVSFDKGNQSTGGVAATVIGTIANGSPLCGSDAPFVTITRSGVHRSTVTSNRFAELWLVVGTDSGFEGITSLYYESIEAVLTPANQ